MSSITSTRADAESSPLSTRRICSVISCIARAPRFSASSLSSLCRAFAASDALLSASVRSDFDLFSSVLSRLSMFFCWFSAASAAASSAALLARFVSARVSVRYLFSASLLSRSKPSIPCRYALVSSSCCCRNSASRAEFLASWIRPKPLVNPSANDMAYLTRIVC